MPALYSILNSADYANNHAGIFDAGLFSVENLLQGYHKYEDNWPEGSNFASSARGWGYFKIDVFAPKFTSQVSTHACVNFLRI